ncbi:MAG TPA: DUF1566 domain-containing protein [Polyangiaceae bacterium]|jgi:hypothetical protein|nr:DUF1566 domain-containing protein [Polyangiaceae bacterium]
MNQRLSGFLVASVLVIGLYSLHGSGAAPAGRYTLTSTTVYDTKTKLTWQRVSSPAAYTWSDALQYCAKNAPWRMPTYKELFTIVDTASTTSPLLDGAFSFDSMNSFTGFWSSTTINVDLSMTISFSPPGGSAQAPRAASYSVRCVF